MTTTFGTFGTIGTIGTDLDARFERDALPLRDVLLRGARRLTTNEADAEDLVQDTLLAAYRSFRTFTPGTNLQAWMFRILHNRWISDFRQRQRRPQEVACGAVTDRELTSRADRNLRSAPTAESEALGGFPDSRIAAALAALPECQRVVVYYIDIQGYTYSQTSNILGIPMGTVMSRTSRARQRLRMALADFNPARNEDTTELAAS